MKYHFVSVLVILGFAIFGIQALFHSGLFTAHDIGHQVGRFYYYIQSLEAGNIPPYWISSLASGYGYPLFLFSYHLPWILGFSLFKLGLDIPTVIKTLFIFSYVFSGIFMYILSLQIFNSRLSSLLSAIMYLWAPFHFLTILVSAAIGTSFVFMFLPVILLGIFICFKKEWRLQYLTILIIGISGAILSHFMTFIFTLPLILIFTITLLVNQPKKYLYIKRISFGIITALLISSFYLIPAIYYSQFTQIKSNKDFSTLYQRNFPNLGQFIYSKWGFAPIGQSAKDGAISFQIGIAQWLSVLILTLFLILHKIPNQYKTLSVFLLITYFLSLFSMLDFSRTFWDQLTKFITIDYPTRSMIAVTFIGSLLGGLLIVSLKKFRLPIFITLVIIALYTNRNHLSVNMYTNYPISLYLANELTTSTYNEYLPKQANVEILYHPNEYKTERTIINQFAFPGQTVYIDGQKTSYKVDPSGRIKLDFLVNKNSFEIKFEETSLIKLSKILTLIGLLILVYVLLGKYFTLNKSDFVKPKK